MALVLFINIVSEFKPLLVGKPLIDFFSLYLDISVYNQYPVKVPMPQYPSFT